MSTENGLQPLSPLRRLSILSIRSRNSVHISQEELLLLDDCKRMVKEVHKSVAAFKDLLLRVGQNQKDTPELRDDIRKIRRKCIDLCRRAKTRMLPSIRNSTPENNDQLYKYFYQLISCMQIFTGELKIAHQLLRSFPMQESDLQSNSEKDKEEKIGNSNLNITTPGICVGGEPIQINISDPSNESVPYQEESSPNPDDLWDESEINHPELARLRKERLEIKELFGDIEDLIPEDSIDNTEELWADEIILGKKIKSHKRKYRRSPMICCSCQPEYI